MGGCCCCPYKATVLIGDPACCHYPRVAGAHVQILSHHGAASTLSGGLLVDTNLDTSIPDTYRPPPAPIPYDVTVGIPQTPPIAQEMHSNKVAVSRNLSNSSTVQAAPSGNNNGTSLKYEDPEDLEHKLCDNLKFDSAKESDAEPSLSAESIVSTLEEEDTCPICLEEYDAENPKLITKCEHHFHLACILDWMERSETCPVCDKNMIFDSTLD